MKMIFVFSLTGPRVESQTCLSLSRGHCGDYSNNGRFVSNWFLRFSALVEGTKILETLENLPTFNERPRSDCRIAACGIFVPEPETILNVDSKTTFGVDSKSIFAGVDSKASVDCVDLKGTVNGVDSKGTVNGVDSKGSLPEVEKATSENI